MHFVTPHLLITDDDPAVRSTLGELLTRRGFDTTLASDGEEGLEIVRAREIHLVVMDFHMPKLTGLEMLAQISEARPTLPCILMSGKLDESIRCQAERLRAYSVIEKPLRISQIHRLVLDALKTVYGWGA